MSAREVTAVATAAVALLIAHGAEAEDAERFVSAQEAAGLLIDPVQAEELLEDCRDQAAAEARAELEELREQLAATRELVGELQEELSALRPPHKTSAPRVVEAYPGELEALRRHVRAVLDICDREQRNAARWETPLPVPEWVAPVQRAALGDAPAAVDGGGA